MPEILGCFLLVVVIHNFGEILDFVSDVLDHGMDKVRKLLGMKDKDDA